MGWPNPSVEIPDETPYMPKKSDGFWAKIISQPFKYLLIGIGILLILIFIFILFQRYFLGYKDWASWTGFGEYQGHLTKDDRGKTLWDWMGLFLIPAFLALGAIWLNWKLSSIEKERMLDQQSEMALQTYINKVSDLLKNQQDEHVSDKDLMLMRINTITTLRLLDGVRKSILVQFIHEAGLINELSDEKIHLKWANLSDSQLDYMVLLGTDLSGSFLTNASMKAVFMRASNLSMTNLNGANLSNAYLKASKFVGAILRKANFLVRI